MSRDPSNEQPPPPECSLRQATEWQGVFFCQHPRMHVKDGLVSPTICGLCSVREIPVQTPRSRGDFQSPCSQVQTPPDNVGTPLSPPSLLQQGWNLAQTLAAFTADGFQTVSKVEYERRLRICDSCDRRVGMRCMQCGCGLAAKARGRAFRCPLEKWPHLK
ncbi:hypothetical protein SH668x_001288 [Planctomicrobium sp. SH668]|uniref:hypothetical protein n=1 Tax=Planctomicrobium sp. SH668 TaxID=3448126 RepID=UPI003F5AE4A1